MTAPVRNALALAAGSGLASLGTTLIHPLLYLLALVGLCVAHRTASVVRALALMALLGACLMSWSRWEQRAAEKNRAGQLDDREPEQLVGTVVGPTRVMPGRQQVVIETGSERIWLTIYQEDDYPTSEISPGQRISVLARLKRPLGLRGLGTANRRYQVMAHGASLVGSASSAEVQTLGWEWSLWRPAMAIHSWTVAAVERQGGAADGRAIVAALVAGERSLMSDALLSAVRSSGLAHLLAVSGMHMAALVTVVFFFVGRIWCFLPLRQVLEPKAVAAGVALVAACSFTALTGARPSTCRALLVASLVLVGIMLDRRMSVLSALAWAAMALLVWRPILLFDVGFQMSFAATTALALAFSPTPETLKFAVPTRLRRLVDSLGSIVRASFWASFATAPIALWHFGEVSGLAVLANVVAVPLVTVVLLPAALLGIFLSALWAPLGALVLGPCIALADGLAQCCYQLETLLPMHTRAPLNTWELMLWGAIGVLLLWRRLETSHRWRVRRRVRWFGLVACLGLVVWSRVQGMSDSNILRVTFVEIGQGDAAVIEVPGGEVWLVDGGGLPFVAPTPHGDRQKLAETPARKALLPYLRHRRIRKIDLAIVSHPHPDHYVGLQAVARHLPIRELWSVHEVSERPGPYETWLAKLKTSGTRVLAPPVGTAKRIGGTSLEVLWPLYSPKPPERVSRVARGDPILTVNDNSLVVRVSAAGRHVLFAGDIEEEAEELMVEHYGNALRADILKVPHHGSRTSSTEAFVAATRPLVAVISCGRANQFNFPAPEVTARWLAYADQVLRTDEVGSITVEIRESGQMQVQTVDGF